MEENIGEESLAEKSVEMYEKEIYDLRQLLEISKSLSTMLELDKLIEAIVYIAMAQMRVIGAGIFLYSSDSDEYSLGKNYNGFEVDMTFDYDIQASSPLIEKINQKERVFSVNYLETLLPGSKDVKLLNTLGATAAVPLIHNSRVIGILVLGERIAADYFYSEYEIKQICTIASLAAIAVNNAYLVERSSTDMMTHLKLKYYFFNVLTEKLDSAVIAEKNLCVMMIDIDSFKKFNDTYGHACGDFVLQKVAEIITKSIRSEDMASRYGGEEFTVLLDGTSCKDAMIVAERIRKNIEEHDFVYQDEHLSVTVSLGVSEYSRECPVNSASALVELADRAMYASKHAGKNRTTFAGAEIRSCAN